MKKRIATLLLAGIMAIGTAVPAMADTGVGELPATSAMRTYDDLTDEEKDALVRNMEEQKQEKLRYTHYMIQLRQCLLQGGRCLKSIIHVKGL